MMFLINNMFIIPYIEHTYSYAVSLKPELFEVLLWGLQNFLLNQLTWYVVNSILDLYLLTNEPHMSHGMFNFDYKGSDYRTQFKLGNGGLLGASYIQSVTPHLSLGGEVLWAGQHRKSGLGYAVRYNTDKMVEKNTRSIFSNRSLLFRWCIGKSRSQRCNRH
ncbi:unnamed protein product [Lactuca virosa]|uniref:Uncharacterized protein n=1 Tax=Lactuca virosa TaxID=75947 RepID=A0AAU9NVC4_9ASTR|nr:unnamed protein product [Lactuca virosa]